MNIFITQSAEVGAAKAYLLQQVLAVAARKENHQVVEHLKEADIVIVVGNMLPVNPQLMGKKVYLIGVEPIRCLWRKNMFRRHKVRSILEAFLTNYPQPV